MINNNLPVLEVLMISKTNTHDLCLPDVKLKKKFNIFNCMDNLTIVNF